MITSSTSLGSPASAQFLNGFGTRPPLMEILKSSRNMRQSRSCISSRVFCVQWRLSNASFFSFFFTPSNLNSTTSPLKRYNNLHQLHSSLVTAMKEQRTKHQVKATPTTSMIYFNSGDLWNSSTVKAECSQQLSVSTEQYQFFPPLTYLCTFSGQQCLCYTAIGNQLKWEGARGYGHISPVSTSRMHRFLTGHSASLTDSLAHLHKFGGRRGGRKEKMETKDATTIANGLERGELTTNSSRCIQFDLWPVTVVSL